jgi:hypothetical protein
MSLPRWGRPTTGIRGGWSRCSRPGVRGSAQRLQVAGLSLRLLAMLGNPDRVQHLVGAQLHAEIEVERLDELWGEPAAGEDR